MGDEPTTAVLICDSLKGILDPGGHGNKRSGSNLAASQMASGWSNIPTDDSGNTKCKVATKGLQHCVSQALPGCYQRQARWPCMVQTAYQLHCNPAERQPLPMSMIDPSDNSPFLCSTRRYACIVIIGCIKGSLHAVATATDWTLAYAKTNLDRACGSSTTRWWLKISHL